MGILKSFGAIALAVLAFLAWTSIFVVDERQKALVTQLGEIQREINESEVGQTHEVLIERLARSEGDVLGRTETNKMVAFPGDAGHVGEYADVRLTGTTGATFMGLPC